VDDAITTLITAQHLVLDDIITAPVTASSSRTQKTPPDMDDASSTPINTPSPSSII
jgi:hypothetical protein